MNSRAEEEYFYNSSSKCFKRTGNSKIKDCKDTVEAQAKNDIVNKIQQDFLKCILEHRASSLEQYAFIWIAIGNVALLMVSILILILLKDSLQNNLVAISLLIILPSIVALGFTAFCCFYTRKLNKERKAKEKAAISKLTQVINDSNKQFGISVSYDPERKFIKIKQRLSDSRELIPINQGENYQNQINVDPMPVNKIHMEDKEAPTLDEKSDENKRKPKLLSEEVPPTDKQEPQSKEKMQVYYPELKGITLSSNEKETPSPKHHDFQSKQKAGELREQMDDQSPGNAEVQCTHRVYLEYRNSERTVSTRVSKTGYIRQFFINPFTRFK